MTRKKTERKRCVEPDCKKYIGYKLNDLLTVPFEVENIGLQRLFSYFLHIAPDIESEHSRKIPVYKHKDIFEHMMENRHFKYYKFCGSSAPIEREFEKGYINGDEICFKCKRFVCKKKQSSKSKQQESELDCFLRHIRNSIAHGRVYYNHSGNKINIMFEDKNNSGNLSARIICIKADLEHWKKILDNKNNYESDS